MSPRQLPETLNFIKQAERNVSLDGDYPLSQLKRLNEALNDASGEVSANVNFGTKVGFYCLDGRVQASLEMVCQRCMEPMKLELKGCFRFALIQNEEEVELLPADMEPYLVDGGEQSIIDIVEDELLLSLPMVAIHQEECSEFLSRHNVQRKKDEADAHPFAALKDLKSK